MIIRHQKKNELRHHGREKIRGLSVQVKKRFAPGWLQVIPYGLSCHGPLTGILTPDLISCPYPWVMEFKASLLKSVPTGASKRRNNLELGHTRGHTHTHTQRSNDTPLYTSFVLTTVALILSAVIYCCKFKGKHFLKITDFVYKVFSNNPVLFSRAV